MVVSPLPGYGTRSAEGAAGALDRRQPRQPSGRFGATLGVPSWEGKQHSNPMCQRPLLRPAGPKDGRVLPGQHNPHGQGPIRRQGGFVLPAAASGRGKRGCLPGGHALCGWRDWAFQGRSRHAGAAVRPSCPAGVREGHILVLEEGRDSASSGKDRGGFRPAGSVRWPEELQAELAQGCPGTAMPRCSVGGVLFTGAKRP